MLSAGHAPRPREATWWPAVTGRAGGVEGGERLGRDWESSLGAQNRSSLGAAPPVPGKQAANQSSDHPAARRPPTAHRFCACSLPSANDRMIRPAPFERAQNNLEGWAAAARSALPFCKTGHLRVVLIGLPDQISRSPLRLAGHLQSCPSADMASRMSSGCHDEAYREPAD